MGKRTGLYPGTFDPPTKGHLDIIRRAAGFVDELVIGVAVSDDKVPLFTPQERVSMLEQELSSARIPAPVRVVPFSSLLMEFARKAQIDIVVRGLRSSSDFEYEHQMAGMNRMLDGQMETVFLMASPSCQAIASRLVKEVARMGGDVSAFVPPSVAMKLEMKIRCPDG